LITPASGVSSTGLHIDGASITVPDGQRSWAPFSLDMESTFPEHCPHVIDMLGGDNQIQIVVRAGLSTEEGIDTPTTVDPGVDACCLQRFKSVKNLILGHHELILSNRVPPGHLMVIESRKSILLRDSPQRHEVAFGLATISRAKSGTVDCARQ
jgi:hypothetical protein